MASENNTNTDINDIGRDFVEFPGHRLRQAREDKGLTQDKVVRDLNFTRHVIDGLENSDFSKIKGPVFARGYIRSYARYLGLDAEALVATYNQGLGDHEPITRQLILPQETIGKNQAHPSDVWVKIIGALLIVLLFGGYWWWQNQDAVPEISQLVDTAGSADTVADDLGLGLSLSDTDILINDSQLALDIPQLVDPSSVDQLLGRTEAGINVSADANTDGSVDVSADNITSVKVDPAEIDAVIGNTGNSDSAQGLVPNDSEQLADTGQKSLELEPGQEHLFISFNDDCWVEVRDSAGVAIISRVYSKFETVDVTVDAPVKVLLGRFLAVEQFTFADKDVDLEPHTRKNIVRITLEK